jgi:glycosyltransferase involved in cell wall biosynthesis
MRLHLINPMVNYSGSELRTLALYNILRDEADVTVWSQFTPNPKFSGIVPIRRIIPYQGRIPIGGTMVFVGFYYHVGRWPLFAPARRRILICNTNHVPSFQAFYRRISNSGRRSVELVYASVEVKDMIGPPGVVQASPIDITEFTASDVAREGQFRVGRLSRDSPQKHHEEAPEFYRRLVEAGCGVRIMGGTLLADRLSGHPPELDLLPAGAESGPSFLRGLDCFYYRTNDSFFETFGRVVFEAMACGLPVVVHRRGGYTEFLHHGEDAFIFDTDDEAFDLIMRLQADPALRRRIGRNARKRVEQMYSEDYVRDLKRYYLS